MTLKKARLCLFAGLLIFAPFSLAECPENAFFCDSFESGDLLKTNEEGFRWGATNRTSIVTHEPGPTVVWNGSEVSITVSDGRNWEAKDGKYSLRVRYAAGAAMSEQRFDLGASHPNLWVSFWMRVPTNFYHDGNNYKFFSIWTDAYSQAGEGSTAVWEYWGNSDGISRMAIHNSEGNYQNGNGHRQHKQFMTPGDAGRWMQVFLHIKVNSSQASSDGIMELYQRWENENTVRVINRETTANLNLPKSNPAITGWTAGYLLGWANPGFSENTEFLIDDIVFSDFSLIEDFAVASQPITPPGFVVK